MPVSCHVVVPHGPAANFDFEEVPRVGDYLLLPGAPGQLRVDRVVFAPVGSGPQNVELVVSRAT
jgi:hypothetical protein